jgi:DNA polymerase III subunit delta'
VQFSQIPGLSSLKETLRQSVVNNHVSHAQLFYGQEGGVQLAMALAYATYINCEQKLPDDSCGQCASCLKYNKLIHPDLHFVFPITSTKKVKASEGSDKPTADSFMVYWREFVEKHVFGSLATWHHVIDAEKNQQAIISAEEARKIVTKISLKAYEATYKVMCIWLPEYMNETSANAILKILEEPPAKTLFLMVSNDPNKLLATIRSRAVGVHVPLLETPTMVQYLESALSITEQEAQSVAKQADGNILKALEVYNNSNQELHQQFENWMRASFKVNISGLISLSDEFDTATKTDQKELLAYALEMFRESFLYKHNILELQLLDGEKQAFVQNFSKVIHPDKYAQINLLVSNTMYHLERNARAKMQFLDLSLQLARLFQR